MQLAPISLYLVYDKFVADLDAARILKRVIGASNTDTVVFTHLKHFLPACLLTHNSTENKTYVIGTDFSTVPSIVARRWAKEKFEKCFPALSSAGATATAGSTLLQGQVLLDIIAAISSTGATSSATPTPAPSPTEKKDNFKGISKNELAVTLQICGQASTGEVTDLLAWIQDCAAKGTSEHYNLTIIQKYVTENALCDNVDVSITSPLLKMIMKRAWTGKDVNVIRTLLLHAMEGLSPFTMLNLNEDEAALLNNEEYLISSASVVSVANLRLQQRQLQICIPSE